MIRLLSSNIISPLAYNTGDNYRAVKSGKSAIAQYCNWNGIPDTFAGSMFTPQQLDELKIDGYTRFEYVAIRSIEEALSGTEIDVTSSRTVLILSTTKGDVEELSSNLSSDGAYLSPGAAAKKIAAYFGMKSEPVVCCNACISGVSAQVLADRLISCGYYDNAIVCGTDCLSRFVISGFLCFKSLSAEACRPFDIERLGLNLGEAAATMVFTRDDGKSNAWRLVCGSLDNDAHHVSAPSPNGAGALKVIERTMEGHDIESLAFVNVHGTATMFNDQMESKAIQAAGLSDVPLTALKGWYGHTLGASGVLETILSMASVEDGCILPVRGFSNIGVSGKVNIGTSLRKTDKNAFLKIISGFGGCNGAVLYTREPCEEKSVQLNEPEVLHKVILTSDSLSIDGETIPVAAKGKELLTEIYKTHIGDYPKFYKMDMFSRLVFLASELLILREDKSDGAMEHSVVLFNRTSSIVTDRKHIATIEDPKGFFPSPSVFLYTLPNIVTGEIAIKHGYTGETSLYILEDKNIEIMAAIVKSSFAMSESRLMITGWADCSAEDTFEAELCLLRK